jgi:hypothetical protein
MTRSKDIVKELRPNTSNVTISYGDKSSSNVLDLGKVVITPGMLFKTIVYNLLFVRQLATVGFAIYFDVDFCGRHVEQDSKSCLHWACGE